MQSQCRRMLPARISAENLHRLQEPEQQDMLSLENGPAHALHEFESLH